MTAEKDPEREPRSTMSKVEVPVSDATREAFRFLCSEHVWYREGSWPDAPRLYPAEAAVLLRYLDELDEPSAHHRPRLNALLLAAKQGQLA